MTAITLTPTLTPTPALTPPLTPEQITAIGTAKSSALSRVRPEIWYDYDWADDALYHTHAELTLLVRQRNLTLTGTPETSPAFLRAAMMQEIAAVRAKYAALSAPESNDHSDAVYHSGSALSAPLIAEAKLALKLLSHASRSLHNTQGRLLPSPRARACHDLIKKATIQLGNVISSGIKSAQAGAGERVPIRSQNESVP